MKHLVRPLMRVIDIRIGQIHEWNDQDHMMDGSGECGGFIDQGFEASLLQCVIDSCQEIGVDIGFTQDMIHAFREKHRLRLPPANDDGRLQFYDEFIGQLENCKLLTLPNDGMSDLEFIMRIVNYVRLLGYETDRSSSGFDPTSGTLYELSNFGFEFSVFDMYGIKLEIDKRTIYISDEGKWIDIVSHNASYNLLECISYYRECVAFARDPESDSDDFVGIYNNQLRFAK